ncbi:MAG: insulinase family protein [Candidatus Aminicenantes bacterium]|nr:MAG: insulinase family protein [Candidatus Aminicenantes bacterium]
MKMQKRTIVGIFLILILAVPRIADGQEIAEPKDAKSAPLDKKIPVDPKVTMGQFANGLRYYIRENRRPENRAELRLVVNAGSVMEDDDQLGLAHFLEHMAFNGTKNFAKHELIEFMESIGMRFGPGLNAYTSYDETVYMLQIPTESAEIMEKAFQILEDWTHALSLANDEIDKERGVIIEEWRLGRGARARMMDKQFPIIFKGSHYADRLTIGKKEIIERFDHDVLKRFYRDWYRPDLMAVITVGDFESAEVESLIKGHFADLPKATNPRPRTVFAVPDHEKTLFAIATDKEAMNTSVAVIHKLPLKDTSTVGAYRSMIVEQLYHGMLNQRFSELAQKKDPPFLGASSGKGQFVRSKEVYVLNAGVEEDGIKQGLEALFVESERVSRHGFTPPELDRQKRRLLRSIERAYTEREKNNSNLYVSEYIRNFLEGEPIPGIEYEFELFKRFLPEIALEEVNQIGKDWLTGDNRVIMANAPEKEGLVIPTEEDLRGVMESVADMEILPYEDTSSELPLMAEIPEAGEIVDTKVLENYGITEWKLSNGARIVLKPTDFKEDEIVFQAISKGGTSLASNADYLPARTASQVISVGGVGEFSAIALQKKLAGKVVSVRPIISDWEEGFIGSASPKDVETLFQLINLYFTAPRADATMFAVLKNQMKSALENRNANPMFVFYDTLGRIMTQDHPRARSLTVEQLEEMDLEKSLHFYKDRFADASDFIFVFVGNLDLGTIKPLVTRYLASLPSLDRQETWKDVGIRPPKGVVKKTVTKGVEPQSQAAIVFTGPFEYTQANRNAIRAMGLVLQTRLRNKIREDLGGTYNIMASPSYDKIPEPAYSVAINFGTDPERVEELISAIFQEIETFKTEGATADELRDAKQAMYRDYETGIKKNRWLMTQLYYRYLEGEDLGSLFNYEKSLDDLTAEVIHEAARTYLNTDNFVQVTLFPEKEKVRATFVP